MAVYDPSLSLTDALQRGYSRMVLISANGDSSINLGLQYRQETGYNPAYDYSMSPRLLRIPKALMKILDSFGNIHSPKFESRVQYCVERLLSLPHHLVPADAHI